MGDYTVRGHEMNMKFCDPIEEGEKSNASLPFKKRKHFLSETNLDVPLAKRRLDDSETKNKSASPVLQRETANCLIKEFNWMAVNKTCDCIKKSLKETTISPESDMVPLVEGHNLKIDKLALKNILNIGKLSRDNLHRMVNKILESIYTRVYMSEHSLSGKAPPNPGKMRDLNTSARTLKPGLPVEDVSAITQFAIQFWKNVHGETIKPKEVRGAIRLKISTETRALLSATKF